MEIKFTEIDNLDKKSYGNFGINSNNPNELNPQKYWEPQKSNVQKKKKVSFDDILSNMNLVVNQNGVLQSMAPLQQYQEQYQEQPQYYNEQPQYYKEQIHNQRNNEPLNPSVKHSYIFNNYFKDYKDANNNLQPQPKVPKTIEEYKQMLLEEKIRQIQEKIRISKIKSKKMLFTGNSNMIQNRPQGVIRASKNNLRSMKFG